MDSLPQSLQSSTADPAPGMRDPSASAVLMPAAGAGQTALSSDAGGLDAGPDLHWVDWLLRLVLWALMVLALAQQLGSRLAANQILGPLIVFAILMAAYLLASVAPAARLLHEWARAEPTLMSLIPLTALLPYILFARQSLTFDVSEMLVAGVLLFLPTALAFIATPRLQRGDAALGLITVAMPLIMPLTRGQALTDADILLRVGAIALPMLLLLFATSEQKSRLNFLFLCAVLSLWYSVEFNAFPTFSLPGQSTTITYFHLVALPAFLYILAAAGRFGKLGLSFKPSARDLSLVASNLALFVLIAIPLGLVTKFITPGFNSQSLPGEIEHVLTLYLFVALPEEILFRGTIFRYLDDTMGWPQGLTIVVSAVLFGAAHLDARSVPNAGWYFVLATIAGVFYARTYLATHGNVGAAATLHAAVDWLWALLFAA